MFITQVIRNLDPVLEVLEIEVLQDMQITLEVKHLNKLNRYAHGMRCTFNFKYYKIQLKKD
jgi:hypothetical protein